MFLAHLPAGYLLGRGLLAARLHDAGFAGKLMPIVLAASVLPDFDLFYFYLVDNSRSHHYLPPHLPIFWLPLAAVSGLLWISGRRRDACLAMAMFIAVQLHLLLDSFSGGILWLYPFSERSFSLVVVPDRFNAWILNFLLHWSILAELAIVTAALLLPLAEKRRRIRRQALSFPAT